MKNIETYSSLHLHLLLIHTELSETTNGLKYFLKLRSYFCVPVFSQDHASIFLLQVNLFQNSSLSHQLTHNMTTDCSLNYKFSMRKI